MSSTDPSKRTSRRARASKGATEGDTAVQSEKPMADHEKSTESPSQTKAATAEGSNGRSQVATLPAKEDSKEGAIQVSPSGSVWSRPITSSEIEVVESYSAAGLRPIAASHLKVYGTILNNRPIMASDIRVTSVGALADHRPIFASDLVVRDDLTLPGGRPIAASDPKLLEATLLPGGRPVASNEIDDSETLMGYID